MTSASPQSPFNALSRQARRLVVLIGDDQGGFPQGEEDVAPWLKPLVIHRVSGGQGVNEIQVEVLLSMLGERYQDVDTPVGHHRIIEVRDVTDGFEDSPLLAWGKLAANSIRLGGGETTAFTARIDWCLLGGRLRSMPYWDGIAGAEVITDATDWIFNPEEQVQDTARGNRLVGVVLGNRSSRRDSNSDGTSGPYYFAHPESFRTEKAIDQQVWESSRWTIAEAVNRVCWSLNPDEEFLTNPTLAELEAVLTHTDRDELFRNVRLPIGSTLPEALDALLLPYGYSWHLDWSGEIGDVTTKLKVFDRGTGLTQSVRLQRIGERINADETDLASLDVDFDLVAYPNVVIGRSAPQRREITIKLYPAWHPDEDVRSWQTLQTDEDFAPDGAKRIVGRKWIANEAGDYTDLRPSITAVPDFSDLSDALRLLNRRRRFFPCLSRNPNGMRRGHNGYHLEWLDVERSEIEAEFSFSVLQDELGIWISDVPVELWQAFQSWPEGYYLTLTATIELDAVTEKTAERREDSPNGVDVPLVLDLSQRFRSARLQQTGPLKSRFLSDHEARLLSVEDGPAGSATVTFDGSVADKIKPGQTLSILSASLGSLEAVYRAKSVDGAVVTVLEEIDAAAAGGAGQDGVAQLNADAEACDHRLTEFVKTVRDYGDHALVAPRVTLFGMDHPQYRIGQLIDGAMPRNVTFAGLKGGQRAPQIVGITIDLQAGQSMQLHLEQIRKSDLPLSDSGSATGGDDV